MFKHLCDSDNYETPISVWRQLLPYLKRYKVVVDPFYCNGRSKIYWEDLGKACISLDSDAYQLPNSFESDVVLVTNPPFSQLEQALTHFVKFDVDCYFLVPTAILHTPWFADLDINSGKDLEILQVNIRSGFIKNGFQLRESPTACCFVAFRKRNRKQRL